MTVFKGYMLIIKKKIGVIFMYFAIFTAIAVLTQYTYTHEEQKNFTNVSRIIGVADMDNSELSKGLIRYLSAVHEINKMPADTGKLQESLYYYRNDIIIQIPKGFEKSLSGDIKKLKITRQPGSYNYMYISSQTDRFLNMVKKYCMAGYNINDSVKKVCDYKGEQVELISSNNDGGIPNIAYLFRYFVYLSISVLCYVLGMILVVFRKREIKNRIGASAVSDRRQAAEAVGAFLIVGTALWALFIIIGIALYRDEFFHVKHLEYYFINSYMMMLVSLALAFLIGMIIEKENIVNMIVTPLALGMCFLGGVFVPLNVAGNFSKKLGHFLPSYWYEVVNDRIAEFKILDSESMSIVWSGIGMQALFVIAFIGAALAVMKYKKQER